MQKCRETAFDAQLSITLNKMYLVVYDHIWVTVSHHKKENDRKLILKIQPSQRQTKFGDSYFALSCSRQLQ